MRQPGNFPAARFREQGEQHKPRQRVNFPTKTMKTHKKPTQAAVILRHLKKHRKGLTTMEAFSLYGITRLAARIAEIEQVGTWEPDRTSDWLESFTPTHTITRHREKTASGATVTRYKLAKP